MQNGDIYDVKKIQIGLLIDKYDLIDDIIDKIFVLDKNDIVTTGLSQASMDRYLGADFSKRMGKGRSNKTRTLYFLKVLKDRVYTQSILPFLS